MLYKTTKAICDYLQSVEVRLEQLPEDERAAIIDNLESQIHEALNARCHGTESTPDDVKAVLAEMDPPEAFGPEQVESTSKGTANSIIGKVALVFAIFGLAAVLLIAMAARGSGSFVAIIPVVFPSELIALILGLLSKGDRMGKIAIISSLVIMGSIVFAAS